MAAEPSKWNVAPGTNADCNDIPDTVDADSGLASLSAFFPQLTALPLSAGGRAPKREDFNGIFKKIAQWVYFYMQGGVPSWAKAVAYTAGSLASYGGKTWTALKNSTNVKPAEGAYWHALTYYYSPASLQADLLNKVYPVGSIYMSVVNVSPASFLGGTWQAIEQGRMLMAAGSSWQAGTTGGNAYHTLTIAELPAHNHSATETAAGGHTHGASTGSAGAHAHSGSALEDGAHAHNASTGTAGAHAHSGSALEDGAHAHNASTGTAGSHDHASSMGTAGAHDHGGDLRTARDGAHSHGGTTDYAGSHTHTRGSMNITGSFSGVGDDGVEPSYSGAFYKTGGRTVPVSNSGDPDYVIGFDASRSWTGSTSSNGNHHHSFTTSYEGDHTHIFTIKSDGGHYHSLTISKAGDHAHSVTIASNGKHTHNLSIASDGAHAHSVTVASNGKHTHNLSIAAAGAHAHSVAIAAAGAHTHAITIGKTGSGAAFSILPPYIAVYMWRRTA